MTDVKNGCIIRISSEIDARVSRSVVDKLLRLDEAEPDEPIRILFAAEGGEPQYSKNIAHTIAERITAPVSVVITEMASSAALVVLAAGTVRIAFKRAEMLFHPTAYVSWPFEKEPRITPHAARRIAKELDIDNKEFYELCVSRRVGHVIPCAWNATDLKRYIEDSKNEEFTLTAVKARRFGFIDRMVHGNKQMITAEQKLLPLAVKLRK